MGNPLASPLVRYGLGFANALVVAAVAFLFVDGGTLRTVLLGFAVLELLATPVVLGYAVDAD